MYRIIFFLVIFCFPALHAQAEENCKTPELAWDTFLLGLESGDVEVALYCANARVAKKYREILNEYTKDELSQIRKAYVGFAKKEEFDDFSEYTVLRESLKTGEKYLSVVTFWRSESRTYIYEM